MDDSSHRAPQKNSSTYAMDAFYQEPEAGPTYVSARNYVRTIASSLVSDLYARSVCVT